MPNPDFISFPKIARLNRPVVITEKIDGTNAQVTVLEDGTVLAGSRKRWITPEDDNFGFARWVKEREDELREGLGVGTHYGEWWGLGIQRGYGLDEKRFSLFNTARWADDSVRPECCSVVPVLMDTNHEPLNPSFVPDLGAMKFAIDSSLAVLELKGSMAAPGFMDPEGIVIFHTANSALFKVTLKNDEKPKGSNE